MIASDERRLSRLTSPLLAKPLEEFVVPGHDVEHQLRPTSHLTSPFLPKPLDKLNLSGSQDDNPLADPNIPMLPAELSPPGCTWLSTADATSFKGDLTDAPAMDKQEAFQARPKDKDEESNEFSDSSADVSYGYQRAEDSDAIGSGEDDNYGVHRKASQRARFADGGDNKVRGHLVEVRFQTKEWGDYYDGSEDGMYYCKRRVFWGGPPCKEKQRVSKMARRIMAAVCVGKFIWLNLRSMVLVFLLRSRKKWVVDYFFLPAHICTLALQVIVVLTDRFAIQLRRSINSSVCKGACLIFQSFFLGSLVINQLINAIAFMSYTPSPPESDLDGISVDGAPEGPSCGGNSMRSWLTKVRSWFLPVQKLPLQSTILDDLGGAPLTRFESGLGFLLTIPTLLLLPADLAEHGQAASSGEYLVYVFAVGADLLFCVISSLSLDFHTSHLLRSRSGQSPENWLFAGHVIARMFEIVSRLSVLIAWSMGLKTALTFLGMCIPELGVALVVCTLLDYLSGAYALMKNGGWSNKIWFMAIPLLVSDWSFYVDETGLTLAARRMSSFLETFRAIQLLGAAFILLILWFFAKGGLNLIFPAFLGLAVVALRRWTKVGCQGKDIFSAARTGDLKNLKRFIASRCDVNSHTHDGRNQTPLQVAVANGQKECAAYLQQFVGLEGGSTADPSSRRRLSTIESSLAERASGADPSQKDDSITLSDSSKDGIEHQYYPASWDRSPKVTPEAGPNSQTCSGLFSSRSPVGGEKYTVSGRPCANIGLSDYGFSRCIGREFGQLIERIQDWYDSSPVTIGDLTLGEPLGSGGFGKVFKVCEVSTGACYALKLQSKSRDAKIVIREAEAMHRTGHAFIVDLIHIFHTKEYYGLVLELCSCDLNDQIIQNDAIGGLKLSAVKKYSVCILLALEHLHNMQMVFRDLKPENVLITSDGYAKLADFGMARVVSLHPVIEQKSIASAVSVLSRGCRRGRLRRLEAEDALNNMVDRRRTQSRRTSQTSRSRRSSLSSTEATNDRKFGVAEDDNEERPGNPPARVAEEAAQPNTGLNEVVHPAARVTFVESMLVDPACKSGEHLRGAAMPMSQGPCLRDCLGGEPMFRRSSGNQSIGGRSSSVSHRLTPRAGTLAFMAPDAMDGSQLTGVPPGSEVWTEIVLARDWYSFGCCLMLMLIGPEGGVIVHRRTRDILLPVGWQEVEDVLKRAKEDLQIKGAYDEVDSGFDIVRQLMAAQAKHRVGPKELRKSSFFEDTVKEMEQFVRKGSEELGKNNHSKRAS